MPQIMNENTFMEDNKKKTQNDSKKKVPATSKPNTLKQRLPKSKPSNPHPDEDFSFDNEEYTYDRDDRTDD